MLSSLQKSIQGQPVCGWSPSLLRDAMVLSGLLLSAPAHAALNDTIHPFVGASYSYDSNLFRQPDIAGEDLVQSDRTRQEFVGIEVDRPFGRQRFTGSARVSKVTFDRFSQLDYNAKDLSGTLFWQLGNHLDGTVGGTYSSSLTSFTDFIGTERNLRVQRSEFADGGWRFHPSWRVRGRVARDKLEFDLLAQSYLDRTEDSTEVGVDYLGVTGSTVGLQIRHLKGSYPNLQKFSGFLLNQDYTQDDIKLKVSWKFSEINQLQFLGGRAKREHVLGGGRSSSGTNARLTDTWGVTSSVVLVSTVWREFAAFEGSSATYSLNKGVSADARWGVTSKVQATAQLRYLERDFAGFATQPTVVPNDKARSASLGVNYSPKNNIVLGLSVNHDVRTSNASFSRAYRSNGASFNASIEF